LLLITNLSIIKQTIASDTKLWNNRKV